jgi:hypothetical protein
MIGPPVALTPAARITNITALETRYKHFASDKAGAEGKMDYNGPYKGNVTVIKSTSGNAAKLEAAIALNKPNTLVSVEVTGWIVNKQTVEGKIERVLIKYNEQGRIYHIEAG